MTEELKRLCRLQFISHFTERTGYIDGIHMALDGGCRWIQLRMKSASEREFDEAALKVRKLCDSYNAVLVLDDRVYSVMPTGADGVHLGLHDMPVAEARKILGRDKIIGGTANTAEDIIMHYASGADYAGCGPFRYTSTKERLSPVLGTEGYRNIIGRIRELGIKIPVIAIGGIAAEDIPPIIEAGADGIAVSGAVLHNEDPAGAMRNLSTIMNNII